MMIVWQLEYFLANTTIQFLLKSIHIWKSYNYNKKAKGPDFTEHTVEGLQTMQQLKIRNQTTG